MANTSKPLIRSLKARHVFEKLTTQERLYAHHTSRAAWSGARIILRQVSPESTPIFDLIMELHSACLGDWSKLLPATDRNVKTDLENFCSYAAIFLSNIGNYVGEGDRKFVPKVSKQFLQRLASSSEKAQKLLNTCVDAMLSPGPATLGFPGGDAISQYYIGKPDITREEIKIVGSLLEAKSIPQENTRVQRALSENYGNSAKLEVLQAAIYKDSGSQHIGSQDSIDVWLSRGDHSDDLEIIEQHLERAEHVATEGFQKQSISHTRASFVSGSIEEYKEAMRCWVQDKDPSVEAVYGFIEPYRDPFGTRAEFEGIVGLKDPEGSTSLQKLVDSAHHFITLLPWVKGATEKDNGPWEKSQFDAPTFTSSHILAYCSTYLYMGLNLPNYMDIQESLGFKNIMTNRESPLDPTDPTTADAAPYIHEPERPTFLLHNYDSLKVKISIHELLGHGTGKLLSMYADGSANFDPRHPPISPLTGKPINTWYKNGQTFGQVFGGVATAMEECRADCVGAYLAIEKDLLGILGYTSDSSITADDVIYNMYLHFGVLGLDALRQYDLVGKKWTQPHARARHAIFRVLLAAEGGSVMHIDVDSPTSRITVRLNRSKVSTAARAAIGDLMLKLHIWRCTADVETGSRYFENLTDLKGIGSSTNVVEAHDWLKLHKIVNSRQPAAEVYAQPNTFIEDDGSVSIREYDATVQGVIQSWADREV